MRLISIMATIALILAGTVISAQKLSYGLQAGLDLVSNSFYSKENGFFNGSEDWYVTPMLSYNFNAFIKYRISGKTSICIEPGYIEKGGNNLFKTNKSSMKFQYIQLPVLFGYYVNEKLHFTFGPEFSYLLGYIVVVNGENHKFLYYYDIFKRFDLSLMGGINIKVHNKVGLGLRYNHSILPHSVHYIVDEDRSPIAKYSLYHRYLQMVLRYYIRN